MLEIKLDTPLEEFRLKGQLVSVKRDDMMGDGVSLPPWGKMQAVLELLKKLNKPLLHFSAAFSYSGWCLAALTRSLGIEFHVAIPEKGVSEPVLDIYRKLGIEAFPIKRSAPWIMRAWVKRIADERGYEMFRYGFDDEAYIRSIADRIAPFRQEFDMLVVSGGSGITPAALCSGWFRCAVNDPSDSSAHRSAVIVANSTDSTIQKALKKVGLKGDNRIRVVLTEIPMNGPEIFDFQAPFPCNPFWDRHAWRWLTNNIHTIPEGTRVLFWNLGGTTLFERYTP
jgi:hypothetical protein